MELLTKKIQVESKGHTDIIDLTEQVQRQVAEGRFTEGIAHLFVIGSTLALTTIEFEPGLVNTDMRELLERLAPYDSAYAHNRTWGDDNGAAHLRASLLGPSLAVPFAAGALTLGSWQQIVLVDFDTRGRSREVVCQLHGTRTGGNKDRE